MCAALVNFQDSLLSSHNILTSYFHLHTGDSPLHLAIINGDLTAVKYLVRHGHDVNAAAPNTGIKPTKANPVVVQGDPVAAYKGRFFS